MRNTVTFTDLAVFVGILLASILLGHCEMERQIDGLQSSLESRCLPVEQAGDVSSEQKGTLTERGFVEVEE